MNETKSRTRLKRETSIIFNDAEPTASVWTFSPAVQRALARKKWLPKAANVAGPYILPKSCISIRPNRPKVALSQEAKDALRVRMGKKVVQS